MADQEDYTQPNYPDPQPMEPTVSRYAQLVQSEQNMLGAILAGLVAALACAVIWAVISTIADRQIGFMAVGVGILVGLAVRMFGRGVATKFGIVGALLALLGCLIGNVLMIAMYISNIEAIPLETVLIGLVQMPAMIVDLMVATFSAMDLLFYGLAIYTGFRYSFRKFSPEELEQLNPS